MKYSKLRSLTLLALAAGAAFVAPAARAATSIPGDLFLGVHASAGQGATHDFVIDLGQATALESASSVMTLGNVGSDLSSLFGSLWNTRGDVLWGVVGATGSADIGSDPATTLYATSPRQVANVVADAWVRYSATAQNLSTNKVVGMATQFNISTAGTAANSVVQNTSTDVNNWASYQPGGTTANTGNGGISFATFNPSIEGLPANTLDLFRMKPSSTPGLAGDYLGSLSLSSSGQVIFTPASVVLVTSKIDFSTSVITAANGATTVTVNAVRTIGSAAASATVTTTAGTALSGTDFTAPSGAGAVLDFPAGINTASVTITVAPNTGVTGKQFSVGLTSLTGAAAGTTYPSATVILPGIDAAPPSLALTAPTATASITGTTAVGSVSIAGTADDNMGISSVMVSFNGGPFQSLTLTPASTTTDPNKQTIAAQTVSGLSIIGGLNTVRVRATDTSGNYTDVVRYVGYVAKGNLTVTPVNADISRITGIKTTTLPYTVGGLYTLTAKPYDVDAPVNGSHVFVGWTVPGVAGVNSSTTLTFVYTSALLSNPITATYGANPFQDSTSVSPQTAGTYAGLIKPRAGSAVSNATYGYVTATVTTSGAMTGSFTMSGVKTTFVSGKTSVASSGTVLFGTTSAPYLVVPRTGQSIVTLVLNLDVTGATKRLTGAVYDATNVSDIVADLQTAPSVGYQKSYNFIVPDTQDGTSVATFVKGDGFGTVAIDSAGNVTGSISLADGTAGTFSTVTSHLGTFPLYVATTATGAGILGGSISGLITLDNTQSTTDLSGTQLLWFKPANAAKPYPDGWAAGAKVDVAGSIYDGTLTEVIPGLTPATAPANNADFTFADGGLALNPTIKHVNITTSVITKTTTGDLTYSLGTTTPLALPLTPATGRVTGKFNGTPGYTFNALVVQKGSTAGAYGYFLTGTTATSLSGGVTLAHP